MNLHKLRPFLLHDFKDERDLLSAINELSVNFTQKRNQITDYLSDRRLASAYVAFYLTTNLPKLEAVFEWLPTEWLEQIKSSTFIDLGAGPGTFSLAFREWAKTPVEVIQLETSATMREQAKKIWDGLYPSEKLSQVSQARDCFGERKSLLFGHSANEMGPDVAIRYIKELNPDHVLFIEPGTKEFFPQMLKIREALISMGFHIIYPCPSSQNCPLENSSSDWCHQFVQVRQDHDVERLTQMAKKDRRHLPLTVHAYSKQSFKNQAMTRIVRVFPETKFSFEWDVCELNVIKRYQIMKRGMSRDTLEIFGQALAGSGLEAEVEKVLESSTRVKVLSLNNQKI